MQADIDAAREFIISTFQPIGGPVELTAIRDGRVVTDFLLGGPALDGELDFALPEMADANANGWHVYVRIATMLTTAVDGRGGEAASWKLPGYWADVDTKTTGEDVNALYKRLHRFEPQPSLIWYTGGGVQCAWLFHAPLMADDYLRQWKAVNRGLQQAVDSDPVANADRLLRLPGFVNHKYEEKPRALLMWQAWGTRYAPGDFERFRVVERPKAPRVPAPPPNDLILPDWVRDYMTAPPAEGDRNNTLYRMAATLKDYGWPRLEAERTLLGFAGLADREVLHTIESAYSKDPRGVPASRDEMRTI